MYYTVRTGESAFEHLQGESMFQHLMANPERARLFQEAMTAGASRIAASVVEAYDFSRFQTIVDVGGGHGALLATVLRAHPSLWGILFDLSYVVAGAREPLDRAGVLDRCEIRNGDFFKSVPAGGDAYLLMRVIHDWGMNTPRRFYRTATPRSGRTGGRS
jgi:O-methyltransferase domain